MYQYLMQDFGLGQYEGQGWQVFPHNVKLSIADYGFQAAAG
jgi:SRSO17 transposase